MAQQYNLNKSLQQQPYQQPGGNLFPCVACGKEISRNAPQCPFCGEPYNQNITPSDSHVARAASSGWRVIFFIWGLAFTIIGSMSLMGTLFAPPPLERTDGSAPPNFLPIAIGALVLALCIGWFPYYLFNKFQKK